MAREAGDCTGETTWPHGDEGGSAQGETHNVWLRGKHRGNVTACLPLPLTAPPPTTYLQLSLAQSCSHCCHSADLPRARAVTQKVSSKGLQGVGRARGQGLAATGMGGRRRVST